MARFIIILCSAFVTTAGFGQATQTWTGGDGTGTFVGTATNWGGTLPSTASPGDTGQWDGVVPGTLFLTYNGGMTSGFGQSGISFVLTSNQTGSVHIGSPFAFSANLAILNLTNNSTNASFRLGDSSANVLNVIWRPGDANQLHELVNNSASPNTIHPNVRWQSGGGVTHILAFGGTGDWIVTNNFLTSSAGPLIRKNGPGTMFWNGPSIPGALGNGNINSPITINGGTLVLQNNTVLSPSGVDTTGSQSISNNATLQYDAVAQSLLLSGVISGSGQLKVSNGTLTLSGANTYTGATTVSNGTLLINGANAAAATIVNAGVLGGTGTLSGPVTLDLATTLAPGASVGSVGTFTINSDLSIGGNVTIEVNKSLSPSNDVVVVTGVLTNTGTGTLTVSNLGPALMVGDKFNLFNKPMLNGAALLVTGSGANWANHLAVDGSISVIAPMLNFTPTGDSLQFTWAGNGFKLQAQTNSVNVGLSGNWVDYPGGSTSPVMVPIGVTNGAVFFRLVSTP